ARRPVRRSRDDPTPGGVLLIDGEREGAQPLAGELAAPLRLGCIELGADAGSTSLDPQHPGQGSLGVQAGVDTVGHGVPDRIEARDDLALTAQRLLIAAGDLSDAE